MSSTEYLNSHDEMRDIYDRHEMLKLHKMCEAAGIDAEYKQSSGDPIFYGLPHTKQYPMPDEKHVRSAIRFFNYVSSDDEEELAANINKMIKKYKITDLNVGPKNRFRNYYKSSESFMTQTAPIVPYQSAPIYKPGMETTGWTDKSNTGKSDEKPVGPNDGDDKMHLHPIFFTLSYHEAGFGKFVKFMTHAPYSHCSIFFDSSLSKGVSFAGREGHSMIPYGMCNESMIRWAQRNPAARYALYVIYVDDDDFRVMQSKVKEMYSRRTDFRYDVAGCVKTFLGIKNANDTKYFCSGFVAMVLSQGKSKRLTKGYDMMKPMDMPDIYGAHLVDMGIAGNYDQKHVDKEVKRIYMKEYAKRIKIEQKLAKDKEKSNANPSKEDNNADSNQNKDGGK